MNKVEVGQLLTIASGFDRFVTVDRVTTEAWFLALGDVDYGEAQAVVLAHFTGPRAKETFSVRHVLEGVRDASRSTPEAIEADVRSAKARGLLEPTYPPREPLPADVKVLLFQARERDRETARLMYEVES
jgi:hypothetical protein